MLAHELATGKVPNGYRPKIPDIVPKKMLALLEGRWSEKAEDRTSFDEIFSHLSSDTTYFDETVDEDEASGAGNEKEDVFYAEKSSLENEAAELERRTLGCTNESQSSEDIV